jgi:thiol-disulfide isomerase/thioredoxin
MLNNLMWGAERCHRAFLAADEIDSARLYLNKMDVFSGGQGIVLLDMPCFEASQGNNEKALELLSQLPDKGFNAYGLLMDEKELEPLLSDPRMQEILFKMKENARKQIKDSLESRPAPDFTLISITGDTVNLSTLRGKVVLLDFWGIGCGPCYQLMPVIERFYQAHKDELCIYGIESWNNPPEKITETLAQFGWTYPCLVGSAEVSKLYGVTGVPSMFIIDKKGNIRFNSLGFASGKGFADEMYDKLEWLLDELK